MKCETSAKRDKVCCSRSTRSICSLCRECMNRKQFLLPFCTVYTQKQGSLHSHSHTENILCHFGCRMQWSVRDWAMLGSSKGLTMSTLELQKSSLLHSVISVKYLYDQNYPLFFSQKNRKQTLTGHLPILITGHMPCVLSKEWEAILLPVVLGDPSTTQFQSSLFHIITSMYHNF